MRFSRSSDQAPAVDVSIVVVSYNTREMTLAALQSVVDQTRNATYELLVVDNASSDGSADAIAATFPNAHLISSNENHGFARANNIAVAEARGRYVLLLNPDTVVKNGAVDKLVAFAKRHPASKIWGGRTIFADGTLNPASCWQQMSIWNLFCRASGLTAVLPKSEHFNGESYGAWPRDRERDVDIVSGCFLLITRDFWNRLSGFDPTFFMYGEEADLCLRAKALGARPRITPEAEIVHYGGASERARTDKMVKLLAAKMSLIQRHMSGPRRQAASLLLQAWPLSRAIATSARAAFDRRPASRDLAATWQKIWTKRASWRNGWPDAQSHANCPHKQLLISTAASPAVASPVLQGTPRA